MNELVNSVFKLLNCLVGQSKSFHFWKTHTRTSKLAAQTKELRDQLKELRKTAAQKDSKMNTIVKLQTVKLFRTAIRGKNKSYFMHWVRVTQELKYELQFRKQQYKVDVAFAHVQSEREKIKEVEVRSRVLNYHLLCTVAFFRWKFTLAQKMIASEKNILHNELLIIRHCLVVSSKQEDKLVQASKQRGHDMCVLLQQIHSKLKEGQGGNTSTASLSSSSIMPLATGTGNGTGATGTGGS